MIRAGEHSDLPRIVEMAAEFWGHTVYEEPLDPETVWDMAKSCIDDEMLSVLVVGGQIHGFACGVVGPLLGNKSVLAGTELAWWVSPEHRKGRNGIALLKGLEAQAKARGVKYWNMAFMESSMPGEIEKLYKVLGYARTEVSYSKVLA